MRLSFIVTSLQNYGLRAAPHSPNCPTKILEHNEVMLGKHTIILI